MLRRLFVEHAFLRLDARPLDPEAVRPMPELLQKIDVFAVHLIGIARRSRDLCGRVAFQLCLFIVPAIGPNIISFDLERRTPSAPELPPRIIRAPKRCV